MLETRLLGTKTRLRGTKSRLLGTPSSDMHAAAVRGPAGGRSRWKRSTFVDASGRFAAATALLCVVAACAPGRETDPPASIVVDAPDAAASAEPAATVAVAAGDADTTPSPAAGDAADGALEALLARCRDAAAYSRARDGDGLLVMLDGKTVFEDARPGFTMDSPHVLASGSKSFVGVAALCAVADGLLSLDEPVSATIHEWRSDPRKSKVTVRQLLSLASGLESLSAKIDSAASARAAGIVDRAQASIAARTLAAPGERFIYGPSSFYVFGELLKRKLAAAKTGDADIVTYLDRRILKPLGITPVVLRDEAGNANLAGGCRLGAADWARFGEFVRNGGTHDGVSLLAPELVAELSRATGPNPRYGLTWWLLTPDAGDAEDEVAADMAADRLEARDGPIGRRLAQRLRERGRARDAASGGTAEASAPTDATTPADSVGFMAAGKGKQRLYVLPGHRMTVVRFGALNGSRDFHDAEFLARLLGPSAKPKS